METKNKTVKMARVCHIIAKVLYISLRSMPDVNYSGNYITAY